MLVLGEAPYFFFLAAVFFAGFFLAAFLAIGFCSVFCVGFGLKYSPRLTVVRELHACNSRVANAQHKCARFLFFITREKIARAEKFPPARRVQCSAPGAVAGSACSVTT